MAITARTSDECFERFRKHVGGLVADMLPTSCPMICQRPAKRLPQDRRVLRFACGDSDAVRLETRGHVPVYLYIAQELQTSLEGGQQRLRTVAYWYKLYTEASLAEDDAVVRWEYAAAAPGSGGPCRHHVQFGRMVVGVPFGSGVFDFTRFHMPTGWVTMEEVFRFLVHELGVEPPCGERCSSSRSERSMRASPTRARADCGRKARGRAACEVVASRRASVDWGPCGAA